MPCQDQMDGAMEGARHPSPAAHPSEHEERTPNLPGKQRSYHDHTTIHMLSFRNHEENPLEQIDSDAYAQTGVLLVQLQRKRHFYTKVFLYASCAEVSLCVCVRM